MIVNINKKKENKQLLTTLTNARPCPWTLSCPVHALNIGFMEWNFPFQGHCPSSAPSSCFGTSSLAEEENSWFRMCKTQQQPKHQRVFSIILTQPCASCWDGIDSPSPNQDSILLPSFPFPPNSSHCGFAKPFWHREKGLKRHGDCGNILLLGMRSFGMILLVEFRFPLSFLGWYLWLPSLSPHLIVHKYI